MLVADASSAPVGSCATIQRVSADETGVEVVMSVSGALRALVLFCKAVGVKHSPFVTEDSVGKASVTTALTTVARRLTLFHDRSKKRHRVCTCLQGTGIRPCLVSDDQTNCEFVYVGGGH